MCHGNSCRQETGRLYAIFYTKRDGALSPIIECSTRHWLDPLARAKSSLSLKMHGPSERELADKTRQNPLRMDITTEAGTLFDKHPPRKNKALLLDITNVNRCISSNLENAARHEEEHPTDAVEGKINTHRGSFPATYSLLPLAKSTCGEGGSDVHVLVKELAIRRVEPKSEIHPNKSQNLVEGTEVARLRRRFSFVLQHAS